MDNLHLTAFIIGASGLLTIMFLWLGLLIDFKKTREKV